MNLFDTPPTWKGIFVSVSLILSLLFSISIQAQDNVRNTKPTLDRIPDHSTRFSTDLRYVELHGISAGDETDQDVTISVSTRNQDLIESLEADVIGNGKGFVYYRLKEGVTGTATVKVVITDNGETPSSVTQTFRIVAESLNRELENKTLLEELPSQHLRAFPNPAVLSTSIYFSTPANEQQATLDMYTLSGVKIKQLFNGKTLAGHSYSVNVDSRNLATGVYLVRLTGQSHAANLRLVVTR